MVPMGRGERGWCPLDLREGEGAREKGDRRGRGMERAVPLLAKRGGLSA